MTLMDIAELQRQMIQCKNAVEVQTVLDDNGEDNDMASAESVYHAIGRHIFAIIDGKAFLHDKEIACPDCKTSAPDKILSNAVEVLSDCGKVHFGCCECGTMFERA